MLHFHRINNFTKKSLLILLTALSMYGVMHETKHTTHELMHLYKEWKHNAIDDLEAKHRLQVLMPKIEVSMDREIEKGQAENAAHLLHQVRTVAHELHDRKTESDTVKLEKKFR